ncbi:MAG: hypothetical protein Q9223_000370 [Gallowayella weberi]
MPGTIVITGANSSLAIPAVQHLLTTYPEYTVVLTVRNTTDADVNTKKLRATLAKYPSAKTSIHELDLADLLAVHEFAKVIIDKISSGSLPPLASLICNAYYWNLSGGMETTRDGYEQSFQVNYVAHTVLVLRLLGSFGSDGGRVVLLSSDAHWPGKNGLEKYPPAIPHDLDLLARPAADEDSDKLGRGFQRYAVSKLAVVTWMYALNRYLKMVYRSLEQIPRVSFNYRQDPNLSNITAVAINPGNLTDSRALRTNTPTMLVVVSRVLQLLRPLLRFMDPTMRTSAEAGTDVIDLATKKVYAQERGYFTLLKHDISSPESLNEETQQRLWKKTLQWARITRENTALTEASLQ